MQKKKNCCFERFDETVKAIHTGSFGQTPKHSVSADGQHLRDLVNPNIMQAAPEVGANKLLLNTLCFFYQKRILNARKLMQFVFE